MAGVVFVGVVMSLVPGALHPGREDPNNHVAVFAEYAGSGSWIAVHLGQFVGMAVFLTGVLGLFSIVDTRTGRVTWASRLGTIASIGALALYAVLQAVDGVALKHAVDAWAHAPASEQVARLASAEVVRWLEWGTRSYQSYVLGVALALLGVAVGRARLAGQPVSWLMALSGAAYVAQGWVLGAEGFSASNTAPTLAGYVLVFAWSVWLLMASWLSRQEDM